MEPTAITRDIDRRHCVGMFNPHAKLSDADVREVVRRAAAGETLTSIARAFGLKSSVPITHILAGRQWRHVTRTIPGFDPTKRYTRRGEQHPKRRLSAADVVTIRRRLSEGESIASIARSYEVNPNTVWAVKVGRTWRHVPTNPEGTTCP